MDSVRLRTMARKSVLDGGKYEHYSVQQMIDRDYSNVLVFMYYRYSKISFLPDILEELKITGNRVIEKPGTLPEDEYKAIAKEIYKDWANESTELEKFRGATIKKRRRKARLQKIERDSKHSRGWQANKGMKKKSY